jgi:hypothetical protein
MEAVAYSMLTGVLGTVSNGNQSAETGSLLFVCIPVCLSLLFALLLLI